MNSVYLNTCRLTHSTRSSTFLFPFKIIKYCFNPINRRGKLSKLIDACTWITKMSTFPACKDILKSLMTIIFSICAYLCAYYYVTFLWPSPHYHLLVVIKISIPFVFIHLYMFVVAATSLFAPTFIFIKMLRHCMFYTD